MIHLTYNIKNNTLKNKKTIKHKSNIFGYLFLHKNNIMIQLKLLNIDKYNTNTQIFN